MSLHPVIFVFIARPNKHDSAPTNTISDQAEILTTSPHRTSNSLMRGALVRSLWLQNTIQYHTGEHTGLNRWEYCKISSPEADLPQQPVDNHKRSEVQ